ncbi:hypothetical protein T492DRAFT_1069057, partial [Pavlovales sp. CCMP2436]|mmetsp:Transcript_51396/g.120702  ORF Transcript_51396/g.120702 Transcript_51396/m.120702 type:complete len:159 (-) Transcript_51396:308-784(-)
MADADSEDGFIAVPVDEEGDRASDEGDDGADDENTASADLVLQRTLGDESLHFSCKASREFIRVRLEGNIPGDRIGLELAVMQSLRALYGQTGAADAVEVIHYAPKSREALLSVPARAATRLRNALTIITEWERAPMRACVVQSSAHLLSLVGDLRPL